MPKDPAENINQYKIKGGELNEFEFQQNQTAIAQEERERHLKGPAGEDQNHATNKGNKGNKGNQGQEMNNE